MTSLMNMKPHQFAAVSVPYEERTMTFGEFAGALADIYGVSARGATAFHGRIKNFIRLGFPASAHSGKGTAHRYTETERAELCVVMEMTRIGIPPQIAIDFARENYAELIMAARVGRLVEVKPLPSFGVLLSPSSLMLDMSIYRPIFALRPLPRVRDVIDVRKPRKAA